MGETKKWAAGCCCLLFLLIVLFGGAVGGFFLAWTELVVEFVCFTLRLTQSTLELANTNLDIFKNNLTSLNYDFNKPEEWAQDPEIYKREIVQLTEEEEEQILKEYMDTGIFFPREDFLNYNRTEPGRGQLGALKDVEPEDIPDPCNGNRTIFQKTEGQRKRSGGYSRMCPAYIPAPTNLVAFAGSSGSGQIVNLNNYVQWVFNEECDGNMCNNGVCNCRKVARQQQAYVWILSGQSTTGPIQRSITVHSCVAVQ